MSWPIRAPVAVVYSEAQSHVVATKGHRNRAERQHVDGVPPQLRNQGMQRIHLAIVHFSRYALDRRDNVAGRSVALEEVPEPY